jgi:hypothetical protein
MFEQIVRDAFAAPTSLLIHFGALCQFAGFLMHDQLKLRALLLTGSAFYIAYYLTRPGAPLVEAAFWSVMTAAANLTLIVVIAHRRRKRPLTDDALKLHDFFPGIEPGDFRALMAAADVRSAAEPTVLTVAGVRTGKLFHVTTGVIDIVRDDVSLTREAPIFIGELGFLLDRPANATVTLRPGGRVIVWDSGRLRALISQREPISRALDRALNRDMASKIVEPVAKAAQA